MWRRLLQRFSISNCEVEAYGQSCILGTKHASDYMTSDELQAISAMENRVSVLLQVGMSYQQIKELLTEKQRKEGICHA